MSGLTDVLRNRWFEEHKSKLPLGVVPLKYLESTGEQWIDTGVVPENGDVLVFNAIDILPGGFFQAVFSAGTGTCQFILVTLLSDLTVLYYKYFASGAAKDASYKQEIRTKIVAGPSIYINDVKKATSTYEGAVNTTLNLFRRANGGDFACIRVFDAVFIVNKFNFLPALYLAGKPYIDGNTLQTVTPLTDKPGMYDTVSGRFFVNQGTGDDFLYELA